MCLVPVGTNHNNPGLHNTRPRVSCVACPIGKWQRLGITLVTVDNLLCSPVGQVVRLHSWIVRFSGSMMQDVSMLSGVAKPEAPGTALCQPDACNGVFQSATSYMLDCGRCSMMFVLCMFCCLILGSWMSHE